MILKTADAFEYPGVTSKYAEIVLVASDPLFSFLRVFRPPQTAVALIELDENHQCRDHFELIAAMVTCGSRVGNYERIILANYTGEGTWLGSLFDIRQGFQNLLSEHRVFHAVFSPDASELTDLYHGMGTAIPLYQDDQGEWRLPYENSQSA